MYITIFYFLYHIGGHKYKLINLYVRSIANVILNITNDRIASNLSQIMVKFRSFDFFCFSLS